MKKLYDADGITIYNADNLELLKKLKDNSINLIYCDILYNTGKVFDDYNDNLGAPKEAMEWYRPRFKEMKRVLTENGSIFIHCNWRLDSYIRILLDEIFGGQSFRNRIYRKHSDERGFYKNFDSQVDTILYYVKNPANYIFNELKGETLRIVPVFENGYVEERSEVLDYKGFTFNPVEHNKHWIISINKIKAMIDKNELLMINGMPYRKTYAVPIGNLWDEPDMRDNFSRNKKAEAYDTPKPSACLKKIIEIATNEGDLVADFFLGGGTTAAEAAKANRKFIGCDISMKACSITIEKLHKILKSDLLLL